MSKETACITVECPECNTVMKVRITKKKVAELIQFYKGLNH